MAARVVSFRTTVNTLRRASAANKNIANVSHLTALCQRCLSTTTNIYQKYLSKDHEWVLVENGVGTVGITHHAQDLLGEIVYVELPEVDAEFEKDETVGVVESVKAASDVLTPVSGLITEINESLVGAPETVNKDPESGGWFFKIQLSESSELDELMSEDDYKQYLAESED